MRRKGVTLQLLWEEYRAQAVGVPYSRSRFCERYLEFRQHLRRSMRQTHVAGEKLFVDYAGPTVPIIDAGSGEISRAHIFVAVWGASNYTYAEASVSERKADWIAAHVNAFAFFGGVPALLVPDNPRTLIRDLPLTKLPVALREIWEPAIGQVSSDGTFGWIIGGRAALALPLQSLANQGAFLHIWKRQDDGSWKVSLIDDVPLPDLWKDAAPFMAMPPPDAGTAGTPDESLADVERAIVNGRDAWRDRLADGVRELSAGHPPIAGRAAVLTWAASGWLGARFSDATADVASSDDLGVAWGRYTLTAPRATIGTWVRVWHRDIGGRWRIVGQMDTDLSVVSR